jgi:hypothetical protein
MRHNGSPIWWNQNTLVTTEIKKNIPNIIPFVLASTVSPPPSWRSPCAASLSCSPLAPSPALAPQLGGGAAPPQKFLFLAGRDPHHLHSVADHVGGSTLASWSLRHIMTVKIVLTAKHTNGDPMNWEWFNNAGNIGLILALAFVLPAFLTLRHILEVVKCINTNLAILTDRLAPPRGDI